MKIIADLHTHSIASHHAYSTISENCLAAKERGFYAIATTDHAPALEDGAHPGHFLCMKNILPRTMHGIYLLRGIEANILNEAGDMDLDDRLDGILDFGIASIHYECFGDASSEDGVTNAYLTVLEHPLIDLIGHMGTSWYPCDFEAVVKRCGELGKLIEINGASFKYRLDALGNCKEIANLCAKHGVGVMVNSDAHVAQSIGEVGNALKMLEEIGFPEELIINGSVERLADYFMRQHSLDILHPEKENHQCV